MKDVIQLLGNDSYIYMPQLLLWQAGMEIFINLPEHKYLAPFEIL